MMTDIPDGFSDFNLKNVEFVEFIFKPISDGAERSAKAPS